MHYNDRCVFSNWTPNSKVTHVFCCLDYIRIPVGQKHVNGIKRQQKTATTKIEFKWQVKSNIHSTLRNTKRINVLHDSGSLFRTQLLYSRFEPCGFSSQLIIVITLKLTEYSESSVDIATRLRARRSGL